MKDVWGRDLNSGDFVLILNQTLYYNFTEISYGGRGHYGLVVSEKSVFDGDGNKGYKYLYKIEQPINEEAKEYRQLQSLYNQKKQEEIVKREKKKQIKKSMPTTVFVPERGDVLTKTDDKESKWIYLGLVDLQVEEFKNSQVNIIKQEQNVHAYLNYDVVKIDYKGERNRYVSFDREEKEERVKEIDLAILCRNMGYNMINVLKKWEKFTVSGKYIKFQKSLSTILVQKEFNVKVGTGTFTLQVPEFDRDNYRTNLARQYVFTLK